MKIEQQVVSLEIAQKLKELGVKQESLFYYQVGQIYLRSQHIDQRMLIADNGERTLYMPEFDVSAFTVAELGEMLPNEITLPDKPEYWNINRAKFVQTKRYVAYGMYGTEVIPDCLSFEANTEADARAKMLVYLLEQKLITL